MKKTILALVLAALCVMLLSACGAEKPAVQPTSTPAGTAQECAAPAESAAPQYAKEIYLYNWSEYMTQEVLDGFEKEYGIKVIETTFESNDEMLAKLLAGSKGQYDIAVPSNFYIDAMLANDLLEELDFSVITNIDNIDPQFRTSQVDPEGKYTVPYMGTASLWLGNPQKLEELGVKADNYEDLKDPRFEGNILMSDDAQGNICCGLSAMDLDPTSNDLADIEQAKQYLLSINKNVKAYSLPADVRDSMIKNEAAVAYMYSGNIMQAMQANPNLHSMIKNEAAVAYMYSGNIMQAMQANPNLQLALKEEQVSLSIDNLVILKGTKHKTEAELFINYLLRGDVSAKLTTEFPYVCFNTAAVEYLPEELAKSELCLLSDDIKSRIYMINTFNGEAIAAEIDAMVEVKTSR